VTPDELAEFLAGTSSTDPAGGPAGRLRDGLAAPVTWDAPPDDLLDSILTAIGQERADDPLPNRAARPLPPVPARDQGPEGRPDAPITDLARAGRRRRRLLRWGTGLAAAAVAVFAAVVAWPSAGTEITLASTAQAPGAAATARLRDTSSGLAVTLDVRGLPPAPTGSFYQAWMKGPKGAVPIGTFHERGGDGTVELWSGVSPADYPVLTVTLEPEDGDPASSGVVLLRSS
jgi:hypothetical protein